MNTLLACGLTEIRRIEEPNFGPGSSTSAGRCSKLAHPVPRLDRAALPTGPTPGR